MIVARERSHADVKNVVVGKQLVLFDFDGTITTKDTLQEFMIFYHGRLRYIFGLIALSPVLAAYTLKLMPNWKSKEYFLSWFIKNENIDTFNQKCVEFTAKHLHKLIRPNALKAIRNYQASGATVAVVSASAVNWVKPWCDQLGIICLATRLEVNGNKMTGRFEGNNCHGHEKVCRIKEQFNLSEFANIIAYGDTSGDKQMLELAHQQYYKPFRD